MKNKLMTHLVCWYPSLNESENILDVLDKYSEYIEIQFPFSDPIADWPLISKANEVSIENWVTIKDCFDFTQKNIKRVKSKILIMTYYNIVYNYWVEKFINKAKQKGVYGLIIPDVPFDEFDGIKLIELCKKYDINLIQIVSPNIEISRLEKISEISTWFVYAVSQNMTTWSKWVFKKVFESYIKKLKNNIKIPIWVWFWIKTKQDIESVCKVADFAIIWSEIIKKYDENWLLWIDKYLKSIS